MSDSQFVFILIFGWMLGACGSSKLGEDFVPPPVFEKPLPPSGDKETLDLTTEDLKLTHYTQTWKLNSVARNEGADNFRRLQKRFIFPIQFNGWVMIDRVEHNYLKCAQANNPEPVFILEDDHNGVVTLTIGEKAALSLSRLFTLRVEFTNQAACKSIDIQFGVLYGTVD